MKKISMNKYTWCAVLLLSCLLGVVSCRRASQEVLPEKPVVNPITDFEAVKDPNDAFKYSFKNLSSKYKKLEWRFGDDTLSTANDPSHLYLTPGKYQMNLTCISETGHKTKKQRDIVIIADSVVRVTTQKTGVVNQIKFGLVVKAPIASIFWTFNDVTPAVTSTDPNPVRTYVPGSFNTFSVKVTTTAGSVVTITSNNATTEGVLQDITQFREGYTVSAENTYGANENSTKLLDNSVETKFTMGGRDGRWFTYPLQIALSYEGKQTVKMYALANSNDLPNRDPKSWAIEASNDGVTWEEIDSRVMTKNFYNQMTDLGATTDAQRFKKLFFYAIANPRPFFKYRLSIRSNWGEAAMQVNEFRIYR